MVIIFLKGWLKYEKNNQLIDFSYLIYNFKGPNIGPISFIKFKGPNHIFKSIYDGDIALEDVVKKANKT